MSTQTTAYLRPATPDDVQTAVTLIKGVTGKFADVVADEGGNPLLAVKLDEAGHSGLASAVTMINEQAGMPVLERVFGL